MKRVRKNKDSPGRDKVAKKIVRMLQKVQEGFDRFMRRCTKHLSVTAMKLWVGVFCIVGTSLSFYFIVKAVERAAPGLGVDRISVPRYFNRGDDDNPPLVSGKEHEAMQHFQSYMDSLQGSPSGKLVYDSIVNVRPGLMDSVKELEKFYQSYEYSK